MLNGKDFLNVSETARALQVSEPTVRLWERQGRIKCIRTVTGRRIFRREEVEKLVPKDTVAT